MIHRKTVLGEFLLSAVPRFSTKPVRVYCTADPDTNFP
jgi:hypothetical protein